MRIVQCRATLDSSNDCRDETCFRLSRVQFEIFCCWRRPGETLEEAGISHELQPTMQTNGKFDLVQDVTTDCSVIASLCAITARIKRGYSDVKVVYANYTPSCADSILDNHLQPLSAKP